MGNELIRNKSGNTSPMSSQLAEPLWTDPGVKCGICVRELIFITKNKQTNKQTDTPPQKKQKQNQNNREKASPAENERSNTLPKSSQGRKKPPFCLAASWPFWVFRFKSIETGVSQVLVIKLGVGYLRQPKDHLYRSALEDTQR